MTRIEQAELNELEMTEAQLAEKTHAITEKLHAEQAPNGKQRKPRSDRGVPRAPKMDIVAPDLPAPAGAITKQQAAQLVRLAEIMCASHQKLDEARRENHQALHDYCKYVESLTSN